MPLAAAGYYAGVMNPVKKLMSWWRGDPETEAQRLDAERRLTIRVSQEIAGKQAGSSLLSAPTPDLLDPGREDSPNSRWR